MKKPTEETWDAVERAGGGWRLHPEGEEEIATFWDKEGERARLAAAAPELARMLVDIQWAGQIGGYEPEIGCPCCYADPPSEQKVPARRIDAWTRTEPSVIHRGGHKRDCDLGKLLEKAGLPVEWDRSFTT
jgi:hypothetical protein